MEAGIPPWSVCPAMCSGRSNALRKGLFFLIFPQAPSACQALHLQDCICLEGRPFLICTKDLSRLAEALCQWVFMGEEEWKQEDKGRLGPRRACGAGTGSKGSIYTLLPLCDVPGPHHQEPRALFFPLSHEYKPALKVLICTKKKTTHGTLQCCLSWKELHLNRNQNFNQ